MSKTLISPAALGLLVMLVLVSSHGTEAEETKVKFNSLTPEEARVIEHKGTEAPFSGKYDKHDVNGIYTCKRCDAELFRSSDKFDSGCGWPAFDDEIPGTVKRTPDLDGHRVEITCAACGGHLGHVFEGEGLTAKNTRHCVNSISLTFRALEEPVGARAYFAGGCFWGTEYLLQQVQGVLSTRVGYMGGEIEDPTYRQVCDGTTGHAEAVEVVFDPAHTDFETLAKLFFEIHDPTQVDRQGPDVGSQYRSAVYYVDQEQRETTGQLIRQLKAKGYDVVTEVAEAGSFWPAEDYHQDYYQQSGKQPYCHFYQKRF